MVKEQDDEALKEQLYQQIGQLKVEQDWLKKDSASRLTRFGRWLNRIIQRSRSRVKSRDKILMNRIDEIYTDCPFYGSRKMQAVLKREGNAVRRRHVIRLMRFAIYPGSKTSVPNSNHRVYSHLLRGENRSKSTKHGAVTSRISVLLTASSTLSR